MNFASLVTAMAQKRFAPSPQVPHPVRTPAPLRASQSSAVMIEIIPMILANSNGALFGDFPTDHSVVAVGTFTLFSTVRYYRIYLSGAPGAFLSLALKGSTIIETRLYRVYADISDISDWAFWLEDYIGAPVAKSQDEDGGIPFNRSWGGGTEQLAPLRPIETVVDSAANSSRLYHQMMHYSRALTDAKIAEHLWVSAIGENSTQPSGVTVWLGIDVDPSEIKVYPAADAPTFP